MFKFALGAKVEDVITGFKGVVISRTEFINRCIRYGVQPTQLDKDGRAQDSCHFDEDQLVQKGLIELPGISAKKNAGTRTGGPHENPQRRPDIKR